MEGDAGDGQSCATRSLTSSKSPEATSKQASIQGNGLVDACCQTDFIVVDVDLAELKRRMASGICDNVKEALTARSIKATAQSALNKTGWVYNPGTRTYFDYSTNLYYYPETRLYYNYKNGCYYRYNQEARNYEFHYQLESFKGRNQDLNLQSHYAKISQTRIEAKPHVLPNLKGVKIKWLNGAIRESKDDQVTAEIKSLDQTDNYPLPSKIRKLSRGIKQNEMSDRDRSKFKGYYSDSETYRSRKKYKYYYCNVCDEIILPTCCKKNKPIKERIHARPKKRSRTGKRQKRKRSKRLRYTSSSSSLTETETHAKGWIEPYPSEATLEGTKVEYTTNVHSNFWPDTGTGSNEDCEIQIEENDVAGKHASIGYNIEQRNYFVTDLGSATGTTLNSTSENNPGVKTVLPVPVTHKSVLLIGSCIFVLHLHPGYDTCNDCEPGQVKAMLQSERGANSQGTASNQDMEKLRVSELKNLKKKYNLHRGEKLSLGRHYTDRAEQRRKTVGSDNPYEKDEMPTSYDTEIADHNKGHQMLRKLGWHKGESLGKSQAGITEPITPRGSTGGKYGLGYGGS